MARVPCALGKLNLRALPDDFVADRCFPMSITLGILLMM